MWPSHGCRCWVGMCLVHGRLHWDGWAGHCAVGGSRLRTHCSPGVSPAPLDKALARPTCLCGAAGGGDRWDQEPPAGASHLAQEPALCWPPSSPGCLRAVALSACSSLFFFKLPTVRREVTLLPCEGGFSSKTRNVLNCLFAGVLIFELHANQGARISVLGRGRGWASVCWWGFCSWAAGKGQPWTEGPLRGPRNSPEV